MPIRSGFRKTITHSTHTFSINLAIFLPTLLKINIHLWLVMPINFLNRENLSLNQLMLRIHLCFIIKHQCLRLFCKWNTHFYRSVWVARITHRLKHFAQKQRTCNSYSNINNSKRTHILKTSITSRTPTITTTFWLSSTRSLINTCRSRPRIRNTPRRIFKRISFITFYCVGWSHHIKRFCLSAKQCTLFNITHRPLLHISIRNKFNTFLRQHTMCNTQCTP